jgi:hypothetical protein
MSWQQVREEAKQVLNVLSSDPYKTTSEGQSAIGTIEGWSEWLDVLQRRGARQKMPVEQLANVFVVYELQNAASELRNHSAESAASTWRNTHILRRIFHVDSTLRQLVGREATAARAYARQAQSQDVVAAAQVREAVSAAVAIPEHRNVVLALITKQTEAIEAADRQLAAITDLQKKVEDDGKSAARKSNDAIAALTKANDKVREFDGAMSAADAHRDKIKALLDELSQQRVAALDDISKAREELAEHSRQLGIAREKIAKATADLNRQGLADSFAQQAQILRAKRDRYERGFVYSVIAIVLLAGMRVGLIKYLPLDWVHTALLAPIVFGLFWAAWFFSGRSQIISRVVEDYAFKSATALAFEGYKREAAASDPELAKQLLARAIEHFGKNPTRLMPKVGKGHGSPIEAMTAGMVEAAKHGSELLGRGKGAQAGS